MHQNKLKTTNSCLRGRTQVSKSRVNFLHSLCSRGKKVCKLGIKIPAVPPYYHRIGFPEKLAKLHVIYVNPRLKAYEMDAIRYIL